MPDLQARGDAGCQGLMIGHNTITGALSVLLSGVVRVERLELSRCCHRWILNPLRLPFRHTRAADCESSLYDIGVNLGENNRFDQRFFAFTADYDEFL